MREMDEDRVEALATEARRLGADHALAMASWLVMDERQAQSILDDVDPEVMDAFPGPNLSGENADDPTPDWLYREVGLTDDEREALSGWLTDPIALAWEEQATHVFELALQGVALRVLGRVDDALRLERELEKFAR